MDTLDVSPVGDGHDFVWRGTRGTNVGTRIEETVFLSTFRGVENGMHLGERITDVFKTGGELSKRAIAAKMITRLARVFDIPEKQ